MKALLKYLSEDQQVDFLKQEGIEHYRLLNKTCKRKSLVFDIGTYKGSSALAMSSAKKVISYDIQYKLELLDQPKNIQFKLGDVLKDKELLKAKVILIDINHTGETERKMFHHLVNNNWKGLLIMDDIDLNRQMKILWTDIKKMGYRTEHRADGHYTGTGFVHMGEKGTYNVGTDEYTPLKRCKTCG